MSDLNKKDLINWPNAMSMIALLLAWLAIVILFDGNIYLSFTLALLSFLIDFLDGWIARKFNQTSQFGRILDSQVDIFIYLVYPAMVFYQFFKLNDYFSILVIFIFLASGTFRLSRFNVKGYISGFNYQGLPVVFSHLLILLFLIFTKYKITPFVYWANSLILITSILMISSFPFPKPKRISSFIFLLLILAATMLYLHFYENYKI